MGRWYRLMHPEVFQGFGKSKPYFEGWYYKLVAADQQQAISLIPGISMGEDSHAFLQIIDGKACRAEYIRYPLKEFRPDSKKLQFGLGPHSFAGSEIILESKEVSGYLEFSSLVPWPRSLMRPGIMGWYSYMPFMQCYHGLVSAHHSLSGKLRYRGQVYDFANGKGYIEKDWGRSFPRSWIWMQCNNFDGEHDISVMASVAHIPWLKTHFIGFLAFIWYQDELKVFTTYTGARYSAQLSKRFVTLTFLDRKSKLFIQAEQAPGANLLSPIEGNMTGKVNESLDARLKIKYQVQGQDPLEVLGTTAGLEVAGTVDELLTS